MDTNSVLTPSSAPVLAVRAGGYVASLPTVDVLETMRPLPIQTVADAPAFVRGLACIRGEVTPVVDLAHLLGSESKAPCERFVTVRAGERVVALAVEQVLGVVTLQGRSLSLKPPVLGEACEAVAALAMLDEGLFAVLRTSRLMPASLWDDVGLDGAS